MFCVNLKNNVEFGKKSFRGDRCWTRTLNNGFDEWHSHFRYGKKRTMTGISQRLETIEPRVHAFINWCHKFSWAHEMQWGSYRILNIIVFLIFIKLISLFWSWKTAWKSTAKPHVALGWVLPQAPFCFQHVSFHYHSWVICTHTGYVYSIGIHGNWFLLLCIGLYGKN